jgi:hypothetical protein
MAYFNLVTLYSHLLPLTTGHLYHILAIVFHTIPILEILNKVAE